RCKRRRRRKGLLDNGNVKNIFTAMRRDVFRPQVLDERVIACIFRYNVKVRSRIAHCQHAEVKSDVESELLCSPAASTINATLELLPVRTRQGRIYNETAH
ncbi:MAG: hypothetical protein NZM94_00775, partial [Roseiflexus sp.]|nr:hypothetical protein [Roseiflexus sp.]